MIIQAELKCKQAGCEADPCAVDKVIELPSQRGPVKIYAQNYLQARLSEVNRQ